MTKTASHPNELELMFVESVNTRDLEGLLSLYENGALIKGTEGYVVRGSDEIQRYFEALLASRPNYTKSKQFGALVCDNISLTSAQHQDGTVSVEVARQQPNGTWRWVIDQFSLDGLARAQSWIQLGML